MSSLVCFLTVQFSKHHLLNNSLCLIGCGDASFFLSTCPLGITEPHGSVSSFAVANNPLPLCKLQHKEIYFVLWIFSLKGQRIVSVGDLHIGKFQDVPEHYR